MSDLRPDFAAAAAGSGASLAGRDGTSSEETHQNPALSGPAGGDFGADVRAALGGSDERLPPRSAAGAPGQPQPHLPDRDTEPGRHQDPPPG